MPKSRKSSRNRPGAKKKSRRGLLGLGILGLVVLVAAAEILWLTRKKGSESKGGGGEGCTLTVLSKITREAPIQDMEVAADGTLYAVDTQGIRIYKSGAAQGKLELPWESMQQSSIGVGKTAIFVNRTTAPELYRVESDLGKMSPIPIEGAISLYGVAADGEGKVYVSDQSKGVVYTLDENGRLLGNLGGPEQDKGGLVRPTDLCVAENGDIFVIDQGSYRIVRYSSDGKVLNAWKTPWSQATVERIGVLKDRVYINDHLGSGVFVMDTDGDDLGRCTKVQGDFALVAPGQLCAGKDGFLYVGSHHVGQISP